MRRVLLFALFCLVLPGAALAVQPDEKLDDPALESRARELSSEIRCVVCQHESIETSNAGIARDIRILIRERLAEGQDEDQIREYLVSRYGDYILFQPPMKPATWLLWFGPGFVFLIGLTAVIAYLMKRRSGQTAEQLSDDEQRRLKQLVEEDTRP
ncbi:MAG: cytochrome c-type biogenesis protein [Pseudomonadota bacterium]|uniref:cytochrome c-type biogenesis protein n=1 Tax=Fodinicurvata fenggangensis TaxID=1121830 RepID=UPI00047D9AEF|nr:cytochrome c-type biogenesis protein [Fodinicurvata fenggangensis]